MTTLQITIPEGVEVLPQEMKLILAARLYELQYLSLGQAAEMAEVSKRVFVEQMGRYGVSFFNDAPDSLAADVRHA